MLLDELDAVRFFVPGVPVPKGNMKGRIFIPRGRARILANARVAVHDEADAKLRGWEHLIAMHASQAWSGPPISSAIELAMTFHLRAPKKGTRSRWVRTKPDYDKLARSVGDALTGVVYVDDAQVARAVIEKVYGERPGLEIAVKELL